MVFTGLNILAVFVATFASMAIGAVWYSLFAKPWMAAAKLTQDDIAPLDENGHKLKQSPLPYIIAACSQFVIAVILAGTIGHVGEVTIYNAMISAALIWVGFVVPTMMVNHRFQMQPWNLTFIDAGHWLVVFLVQGLIIGAFGV